MTNITTFDMEVVTSRTPRAFVEALFERIDVPTDDAQTLAGITEITTEHFDISTFDGARDAISAELGIEPTVFIQFRPKPSLATDIIAVKRLITAVDKWLHDIGNDVVLVFNGESVMMFRKDGVLKLNEASRGWTDARRSLITYDYTVVTMPALRDATGSDI
ncbi:MAG: SitI3 family protein [Chloroflexota bacterium]